MLTYDVATAAKMREYLALAAKQRVGWFFATDAKGANPWDRLPTYWREEVDAIAALR